MNGYEAMAIMALVLDEATEKAIRDPQFTRYAFDLGDLARQMRYTARMTQEYLKALDVLIAKMSLKQTWLLLKLLS